MRSRATVDFDDVPADPDVEQIHFIGKDIIYFHTLFWPAMLKFAGALQDARPRPRPRLPHVLGREDVEVARHRHQPGRYLDLGLNPEWLRYYFAAKLNGRVEDLDFNPDDFVARVNTDLVGKYVNIASRAAGFIGKRFDGELAPPAESDDDRANRLTHVADRRRAARRRLRRPRVRQGDAAEHEPRRPRQPVRGRAKPWEIAKEPAQRDALQWFCTL